MAALDWLKQVIGGGDPSDSGLAYASSQASPDLLQYAQDVLSGKVAAGGALAQNNYDPNRSFAQNALDPRAIEQATDVAFGIGPGAIRAYHGSPHNFDRFDLSKIGTGEGAQAYGHGLYFAEAEDVARGYRDTLAGKAPLKEYAGQPLETRHDWWSLIDRVEPEDWRLAKIIDVAGKHGGIRTALDMFEPYTRNASDASQWAAAIERFKQGVGPAAKGHMYEVDIHADPRAFLDWDRPLAGQPAEVQRALGFEGIVGAPAHEAVSAAIKEARAAGVPLKDYPPYRALQEQNRQATAASYDALGIRNVPNIPPGDLQASAYHTGLIDRLGDPIAASNRLREAGIPGIRYLDQGSRVVPGQVSINRKIMNDPNVSPQMRDQAKADLAKWESENITSNYAIFDPSIIEILRKYGILPPIAAGGGLGGLGGASSQEATY